MLVSMFIQRLNFATRHKFPFNSRTYAKKVKAPPKIGKWQRFKDVVNYYLFPEKCAPMKDPSPEPDSCAINPKWKQPRVVIIGAGMAGLSAAQRLLQCGISNFLILEATDRPGGRIHSRWMGDSITEFGAMFIEGASLSNLMLSVAVQEGIVDSPLKRYKVGENAKFYTDNGRAIDSRISELGVKIFEELMQKKAMEASLVGNSKNLGEFIEKNLDKELRALPETSKTDILRVIGVLYNELSNRIGQDPCLVRAQALSEMRQLSGGRIAIPLGFGSILAPLLRNLPPCTIMYCKPVHYINWDPESAAKRAVIVCCDKEEFEADYVIVTVSLGVLKQDADIMFCPKLPERKMDAISRLGFADAERIFIQYAKPFWAPNESIGLAWPVTELRRHDMDDWTRGLGELTSVPGSYATLQGMVASNPASILCSLPSERLLPVVGNLIRKFTGDVTLPDPINIQHSSWSEDQFFNGSFTYLALESHPCHLDDLATPVPNSNLKAGDKEAPLLLFAGEATSRENFSTVHGAREAGIREAQRVIELTNYLQGPPICRKPCPPCKTKK